MKPGVAITQIKRDPEQVREVNQNNVKHLEEKFEVAKKESKEAPAVTAQSIQQVNQVASTNEKEVNFIQDRASYLRRVIIANRNDSHKFLKELEDLRKQGNKHKDQHQVDLEQQKSEQQEMENDLQIKIAAALHQLKGLRFLQDIRLQLQEQTIAVKQLIEEEKQLNSDDMTSIMHQILDQRDFYENDLKVRLEAAKKFAKDFADLHMELVTTKIMKETSKNRKQLNEEATKTIELLRENDVLRKKHHALEQQFKISQASVQNLHSDYSTLSLSLTEYDEKLFTTLNENKNRIKQFRDEKDDAIGDLKLRKEEALQKREQLNQELLIVKRELQKVESSRSESDQKEYEILDKMSQTATFVLTAIDKSIDAESIQKADEALLNCDTIPSQTKSSNRSSPKTSPRNSKITKGKHDISQKSDLSKLMLRIKSI